MHAINFKLIADIYLSLPGHCPAERERERVHNYAILKINLLFAPLSLILLYNLIFGSLLIAAALLCYDFISLLLLAVHFA